MPIRPMAAEVEAFVAAPCPGRGPAELDAGIVPFRRVLFLAVRADDPDQPLRQHRGKGRGHHERLDPHVDQPGDRGGGVVGVQGGKDQVAGEARLHGDLGGLGIADLADHDDVRVLAEDGAEPVGEGEIDLRVDLDLAHPLQLVLDRVLDGDDVLLRRVDLVQRGIEGGGLAAAGRAGDQDDAAGAGQEPLHEAARSLGQADLRQGQDAALLVQKPQHHPLAEKGRDDARRGCPRRARPP